jgi:importin subunit beta-1
MGTQNNTKQVRQLAGILLKNELRSKNEEKSKRLEKQWKCLEKDIKKKIREKVFKILSSKEREVRKIASRVIASIASIDLKSNEWGQVVGMLINNIKKGKSLQIVESSIMTLGYLCELSNADILKKQANIILTVIFHSLKHNKNINIKLEAIQCFYNALRFFKDNFKNKDHTNMIMRTLIKLSTSRHIRLRIASLGCIVEITFLYYGIIKYYIQYLLKITIRIANEDNEEVGKQAIEFWCTLCEAELHSRTNKKITKIQNIVKPLCRMLCKQLTRQKSIDDPLDSYDITKAAVSCLSFLCKINGETILKYIHPFITKFIKSKKWRQKEATLSACSAILTTRTGKYMKKFCDYILPFLIKYVKDKECPLIRDTSMLCMGQMIKYHSRFIISNMKIMSEILGKVLIYGLNDQKDYISQRSCWVFIEFTKKIKIYPTYQFSNNFKPFCEAIFRCINNQKSVTHSYACLGSLISLASHKNNEYIINILKNMMKRFNQSIKNRNPLMIKLICGILQKITQKLNVQIKPFADGLMKMYLTILNNTKIREAEDDIFMAIGYLIDSVENYFLRYIKIFYPILLKSLKLEKDFELCLICLQCLGLIFNSITEHPPGFCDKIINILLIKLRSKKTFVKIKPIIITIFGDVAIGIGHKFEKYFTVVIAALNSASLAKNRIKADYINNLRENLFSTYRAILDGMGREYWIKIKINPMVNPLIKFVKLICDDDCTSDMVRCHALRIVGCLVDIYGKSIKKYVCLPHIKELLSFCCKYKRNPEIQKIGLQVKKSLMAIMSPLS